MTPFGNKRGQSLAELATFGVILISVFGLLVSYGMSANYQQKVNMMAFRKAHARAKQFGLFDSLFHVFGLVPGRYRLEAFKQSIPSYLSVPPWNYNTVTEAGIDIPLWPPAPSNNYRYVNYTIIEDKPIPTVSGILPIGKRSPIVASENALWSIDLYGSSQINPFDFHLGEFIAAIDPRNLPRSDFEINGKNYCFVTNYLASIPDLSDLVVSAVPAGWGGPILQFIMPEIGGVLDRILPSFFDENHDDMVDGLQDYVVREIYGDEEHPCSFQREEKNQNPRPGIETTDTINVSETIEREISFRRASTHHVDSSFDRVEETKTWYTPYE